MLPSIIILGVLPAFLHAAFTGLTPKDGDTVTDSLTVKFYLNAETNIGFFGNDTTVSLLSSQKNYTLATKQQFSDKFPVPPAVWANGKPTELLLGPFDLGEVTPGSYKITLSTSFLYINTPQSGVQKGTRDLAYITVGASTKPSASSSSSSTKSLVSGDSNLISAISSVTNIAASGSVSVNNSATANDSLTAIGPTSTSITASNSTMTSNSTESDSYSTITVTVPRSHSSGAVATTTAVGQGGSASSVTLVPLGGGGGGALNAPSQIVPVVLPSSILGGQASSKADLSSVSTSVGASNNGGTSNSDAGSGDSAGIAPSGNGSGNGGSNVVASNSPQSKSDNLPKADATSTLSGVKTTSKTDTAAANAPTYNSNSSGNTLGLNLQTLISIIALTSGALLIN